MPAPARRDYYEILQIERHASDVDVKAAYRRLALRYHPDRNPGDARAEEAFKEISEAYAVLSDADRRARFDRFGQAAPDLPFGPGADLSAATDFFEAIFGDLFGLDRKKKAGQDLRYTLELSFEEAALGCTKTIRFEAPEDCPSCAGSGAEGGAAQLVRCGACEGQGVVRQKGVLFSTKRPCTTCGGEGEVPRTKCRACLGAGLIERPRAFEVRVPPGTSDGSAQRLPGQGAPGRRGGASGDLNVLVRIKPHPFLREEDGVVVCDVPVSLADAALGAEIDVPVLDGAVRMKVPPATQSGAVFRLRGRGIARGGGPAGDLHVRLQVETPVSLTDEQREALETLRRTSSPAHEPRRQAFTEAFRQREAGR